MPPPPPSTSPPPPNQTHPTPPNAATPSQDVAAKLALPSADDAEFVCAKAIRDGGLAARIDRAGGFLVSADAANAYATDEPRAAFHVRVAFCLDVHNEAVRAMRFDADPSAKRRETEEERRERLAAEAELAAALAEDDGDDDEF